MYMKSIGKRVLSNDLLTFCYFNAVALIENTGIQLSEDDIKYLIENDNSNRSDFVHSNWTFMGKTKLSNRFTPNEAQQLDNLRANIKDLSNIFAQSISFTASNLVCMRLPFGFADRSIDIYNHRRKQIEKYGKGREGLERRIGLYYDDNLDLNFKEWFPKYVRSIQKYQEVNSTNIHQVKIAHACMVHGVQNIIFSSKADSGGKLNSGQALRNADDRVSNFGELVFNEKKLKDGVRFTELTKELQSQGIATNCDIIELLESGFVDIDCVYFDPPYGGSSSNYLEMYRFFEEYIYETKIDELPHFNLMKRFSNRKSYEVNFCHMLDAARNIPIWILSCNDSSWEGVDYIVKTIQRFRSKAIVESTLYEYKYRKNNKSDKEYLVVARA